jgi:ribonuclease VapC
VSRAVLDASALLALVFNEPGARTVAEHLEGSILSAVNLSEVATKAAESGMPVDEARHVLQDFPCEIVPFDQEHAFLAATLRATTRSIGLSFGDRACLALGLRTGCPVVTADRGWDKCGLSLPIIQIRK